MVLGGATGPSEWMNLDGNVTQQIASGGWRATALCQNKIADESGPNDEQELAVWAPCAKTRSRTRMGRMTIRNWSFSHPRDTVGPALDRQQPTERDEWGTRAQRRPGERIRGGVPQSARVRRLCDSSA